MTTLRQIIIDGLRESGIIGVGTTPDADEHDEGLRRLNNIIKSLFGTELGEPYADVNYGVNGLVNSYSKGLDRASDIDSAYIPKNVRLIFNNGAAKTLYLHPAPQDGSRLAIRDNGSNLATFNVTLNANGRQIESANSVVLSTSDLTREWFYRADLGDWVRVTDLTANDQSPLPEEFDDLLMTLLALRLNGRYGADTGTDMMEILKRIRGIFRARYRQTSEQPSEPGLYRLTGTCWAYFGDTTSNFDRGQ